MRSPKGLLMLATLALLFTANVWGACPNDPDCKWVGPANCGACADDGRECGEHDDCDRGACHGNCTIGNAPCTSDADCQPNNGLCFGLCNDDVTACYGDIGCKVCKNASAAAGTQASPFCTINQAYRNAASGDTIYVVPGTYHQCVNVSPEGLLPNENRPVHLLAQAYAESLNPDTIANTVIDGTGVCLLASLADAKPVVWIEGSDSSLTGFTVTGGEASGVYVTGGTVTIAHNRITGNTSVEGAGIDIYTDACAPAYGGVSTIVVSDNEITNNLSQAEPEGQLGESLGLGGGIWAFLSESASTSCNSLSTVEIKNNVISGNRIKNENLDDFGARYLAKGGGVFVATAMEPGGTALAKVTDNEISDNGPVAGLTFSTGGGIFAYTRADGYGTETIEISGNTVGPNNRAKEGGGIAAWAVAGLGGSMATHHIEITKNEITDNTAFSLPVEGVGGGGGVSLRLEAYSMRQGDSVSMDFSQNLVSGNLADSTDGGGMRASVLSERSATAEIATHPTPADRIEMTIQDNIIRDNSAQIGGGGAILSVLADTDPLNPSDLNCDFATCNSTQLPALARIDFNRNLVVDNLGTNVGGEYQEVGAGILTIPTTIGAGKAVYNFVDNTIAGNDIGTDVGSTGGVETLAYIEPECHGTANGTVIVSMDRSIVDGNDGYGVGSTLTSYCLAGPQIPPSSLATPVTNSFFYANPSGATNPTFPTTPVNSFQTDPQLTGDYAPAACSPAFELKVCDGTTTTCVDNNSCTPPATCVVGVGFYGNPDIVFDSIIDGLDILDLAVAYNSTDAPDPRYSEAADLDHNGIVDGEDLSTMGLQFGQVCQP